MSTELAFQNRMLLKAPTFWFKVARIIKRIESTTGKFDIIHGNLMGDFLLTKSMTKKTPRIITVHHLACEALETANPSLMERMIGLGTELGITPLLEPIWIDRADRIIAVSGYSKSTVINRLGILDEKIEVIYNGWIPKKFGFSRDDLQEIMKRYRIPPNKPIILFVGRIGDKRKGLYYLLKALEVIRLKIDCALIVVGSGDKNQYQNIIQNKSAENIVFTGYVNDIDLCKIFSLCTVYACPSLLEGFGLTLLDAMSAGKPIVATKTGAIPEIVKDGINGSLVEPGDIFSLANTLIRYLVDENLCKEIGLVNINEVYGRFSWRKSAIATEMLYQDVLNNSPDQKAK